MNVGPLARARLAEAELLLADACPFDRASDVADEKLFGPGPTSAAQAFGAWDGTELIGVAAFAARWLRLIAGVFVMGTVALGYFVNPWWFAFTGFVGLNLFQSAFTNWCPMMWLLERLGAPQAGRSHDPERAGL